MLCSTIHSWVSSVRAIETDYAEGSTSGSSVLTVGGVAHDVICEWFTLRISTTAKGTPPHALTLQQRVQFNAISDFISGAADCADA